MRTQSSEHIYLDRGRVYSEDIGALPSTSAPDPAVSTCTREAGHSRVTLFYVVPL